MELRRSAWGAAFNLFENLLGIVIHVCTPQHFQEFLFEGVSFVMLCLIEDVPLHRAYLRPAEAEGAITRLPAEICHTFFFQPAGGVGLERRECAGQFGRRRQRNTEMDMIADASSSDYRHFFLLPMPTK
jgi:hypothetical protein